MLIRICGFVNAAGNPDVYAKGLKIPTYSLSDSSCPQTSDKSERAFGLI
jgi:hypothetical protein